MLKSFRRLAVDVNDFKNKSLMTKILLNIMNVFRFSMIHVKSIEDLISARLSEAERNNVIIRR